MENRRGATAEMRLRVHASFRDAVALAFEPWTEVHGYQRMVAPRPCPDGVGMCMRIGFDAARWTARPTAAFQGARPSAVALVSVSQTRTTRERMDASAPLRGRDGALRRPRRVPAAQRGTWLTRWFANNRARCYAGETSQRDVLYRATISSHLKTTA